MAINLFLLGAEFFKELYSDTHHLSPMKYLYSGLHGKGALVPWIQTATCFNIIAFGIFLIPATRKNFKALNLGCGLIIVGIWIEKGELSHPVDEFTVTGTFQKMLLGISAVASDIDWNSSKVAPTIKIDNLTISGT